MVGSRNGTINRFILTFMDLISSEKISLQSGNRKPEIGDYAILVTATDKIEPAQKVATLAARLTIRPSPPIHTIFYQN